MSAEAVETFPILLAEDNDDDVFLIRKAIAQAGQPANLQVTRHGSELLEALENSLVAKEPLPALVLLDINMPRMDGFQVIEKIKADVRFQHLPLLVLTTSSRREDVRRAYQLGASSFLTKPADFEKLVALMDQVLTYWKRVTRLPLDN